MLVYDVYAPGTLWLAVEAVGNTPGTARVEMLCTADLSASTQGCGYKFLACGEQRVGRISPKQEHMAPNADWGAQTRREARFIVAVFSPQFVVLSTCDSRVASVLQHKGGGTSVPGGLKLSLFDGMPSGACKTPTERPTCWAGPWPSLGERRSKCGLRYASP